MAIMKDLIRKIRSKGRMDAWDRWWVAELLWQIAKKCGLCRMVRVVGRHEEENEKEKMEEMH